VLVSPGGYAAHKMHVRNKWMVNKCNKVLALWDGSKGGTGNCVSYALSVDRPIENAWKRWTQLHK
jgi:uncharacterized phage-like protein YoqJ